MQGPHEDRKNNVCVCIKFDLQPFDPMWFYKKTTSDLLNQGSFEKAIISFCIICAF